MTDINPTETNFETKKEKINIVISPYKRQQSKIQYQSHFDIYAVINSVKSKNI